MISTKLLQTMFSEVEELRPYANYGFKFLGKGEVGTVFYVSKDSKEDCYAVKIELIDSKYNPTFAFNNEVKSQKAFAPYAPHIYVSGIYDLKIGFIIMDLIDETLDEYLVQQRTPQELDDVIQKIGNALEFLKKKKLTHGDLALFNIGFLKSDRKLVFIDFDRATYNTLHYSPCVDKLRLITEFYITAQSKGVKRMHLSNMRYIRSHGFRRWWNLTKVNAKETEKELVNAYKKYCRLVTMGVRKWMSLGWTGMLSGC
jgi:predicted Ser/Thr protein kinase